MEYAFLIDDDPVYAKLVSMLVKHRGFCSRLEVLENGKKGLERFVGLLENNEPLPEVILLDINMPIMNGFEFLSQFTLLKPQQKKNTSIYMVTSSIEESDKKKALAYEEVEGFVIKPMKDDDFKRIFGANK